MCEKCGHELMIDQVIDGKYIYMCMNPQCENYRKAFALTGEEYQAAIKPKGDKKERA